MRKLRYLSLLLAAMLFKGCGAPERGNKRIVVENTLDRDRSLETVSVELSLLGLLEPEGELSIVDADTGKPLVSQVVDGNGDGTGDTVLFQPEIKANSEQVFEVKVRDAVMEVDGDPTCYSRFVPERTDDYAWENDRVAFRTYGPTAQKMVEDGIQGGTLSSGMDAWLKRVKYPIINKWYKKELETDGSYHEDTGEGVDNFHVGASRGVGGIAVKADTVYHFSKNFVQWKNYDNGPLRTSFSLTYADWDAAGKKISETKYISLDRGSHLSRFEIGISGVDMFSTGLTLHEKDGAIGVSPDQGWISYWEPHEDSELGTGIVVPNGQMTGHDHYITDAKDKSNLFAHIKTTKGKAVYYAGFGWKKSGQFNTKEQWEAYLEKFAEQLDNPLVVKVQ
ncbi:MAG: DUF4861 family protein [Bacteroidota bacterium]